MDNKRIASNPRGLKALFGIVRAHRYKSIALVLSAALSLVIACAPPMQKACPVDVRNLGLHNELSTSNAEWPTWGGNLANTHHADSETLISPANVATLEVKWQKNTGSISANPTVDGNVLYVPDWGLPSTLQVTSNTFNGGKLYALDRWTGATIWQKQVNDYNDNMFNNISRSSPVIAGDLLILADVQNAVPMISYTQWALAAVRRTLGLDPACGGFVYAVKRDTGELVWKTRIGIDDYDQVTQSPTVYNGQVLVGVSSQESAYAKSAFVPCCKFRGNVVSLNLHTGDIQWRTFMTYDNGGALDQFSGAAVWGGSPTIDPARNSVYVPTGNNYRVPQAYADCIASAAGDEVAEALCDDPYPDNHFDSIVALDLTTGAIKWAMHSRSYDAWVAACDIDLVFPILGGDPDNCQDPKGPDADFGQPPMLFSVDIGGGVMEDRLAAGTKGGDLFIIDPDDGSVIHKVSIGPQGNLGGMEFGAATDGELIFVQNSNSEHKPYELVAGPLAGQTIITGFWSGVNAVTGVIEWQTPVPGYNLPQTGTINHVVWGFGKGLGFFKWPVAPLTVANGVVFAGVSDIEGTMVAMDAQDGSILWTFQSGGAVAGAPTIVDGRLYWGAGYKYGQEVGRLFSFGLASDTR